MLWQEKEGKLYQGKEVINMKFEIPLVKEIAIKENKNANSGKQYCDTVDWSGCCYNG